MIDRAAQPVRARIGAQRIEALTPEQNRVPISPLVGRDTDAAPGRDQRPYRLHRAQRQIDRHDQRRITFIPQIGQSLLNAVEHLRLAAAAEKHDIPPCYKLFRPAIGADDADA